MTAALSSILKSCAVPQATCALQKETEDSNSTWSFPSPGMPLLPGTYPPSLISELLGRACGYNL